MSLSKNQLATYIQDLKCRLAVLTADKYSKSLKYGVGCIECLHNKITIARGAIGVLTRFYQDGKDCEGECVLEGGNWYITDVCGYIDSPYTAYTCYYAFVDTPIQDVLQGIVQFDDGTVDVTKSNGEQVQGTYSYNSTTGIITFSGISNPFPATMTAVFSDDCSELTLTYDNPSNAQTVVYTLTSQFIQNADCDWNENCITEEEAEDLYKNTSLLIGKKCSC